MFKNPLYSTTGTNIHVYEFGGFGSCNLPTGQYEFDQAALVNQQQQVVALLAVGIHSDVSSWLNDLLSALAITLPLMIVLSCTGSYWLAGRAMRAVQAITRTARQI